MSNIITEDWVCTCKHCNHQHKWEERTEGDFTTYCPKCNSCEYARLPKALADLQPINHANRKNSND